MHCSLKILAIASLMLSGQSAHAGDEEDTAESYPFGYVEYDWSLEDKNVSALESPDRYTEKSWPTWVISRCYLTYNETEEASECIQSFVNSQIATYNAAKAALYDRVPVARFEELRNYLRSVDNGDECDAAWDAFYQTQSAKRSIKVTSCMLTKYHNAMLYLYKSYPED